MEERKRRKGSNIALDSGLASPVAPPSLLADPRSGERDREGIRRGGEEDRLDQYLASPWPLVQRPDTARSKTPPGRRGWREGGGGGGIDPRNGNFAQLRGPLSLPPLFLFLSLSARGPSGLSEGSRPFRLAPSRPRARAPLSICLSLLSPRSRSGPRARAPAARPFLSLAHRAVYFCILFRGGAEPREEARGEVNFFFFSSILPSRVRVREL